LPDPHLFGYFDCQQRTDLDLSGLLMTLGLILVSIVGAVVLGLVTRNRWRTSLLLGVSTLAVFAFQPSLPVRNLAFWLPTATLAFTVIAWILTTPPEQRSWRGNWLGAVILVCIVLVLGLTRYLGFSLPLTASRPPEIFQIIIGLAIIISLVLLLGRLTKPTKMVLFGAFGSIIVIFIILKFPALATQVSKGIRNLNHQSTNLAMAQDLRWLGLSYIAFRLLHTIRDRQTGRLPAVSLSEYVVYIVFFPTLTAGPIDRIERFIADLRRPLVLSADDLGEAGKRLVLGLFKKFVIADILAMLALNVTNAIQIQSSGWAWVVLYAYAFQIFFDFSGYTDIAIGLGRLLGFKLPENFNAPYLKTNLTQFWNNWHMTLTQWFRAYFFNPVTRALRSRKKPLSIPVIIFITQVATMVLIGLWHGMTVNFVIWGLWHGLGLFVNNRWSELTRATFATLPLRLQAGLNACGVLLTFNFVSLGWVFFALPDPSISVHFLRTLFGLA
jgi:alginate O-acetyltransferase complex protein AlgI